MTRHVNVTFRKVEGPKQLSYLGRKCTFYCYYLTSSKTGGRVTVRRWHDTGYCELEYGFGDGSKGRYTQFATKTYTPGECRIIDQVQAVEALVRDHVQSVEV